MRSRIGYRVRAGASRNRTGGIRRFLVSQDAEVNRNLGRISLEMYRDGYYHVSDTQPSAADDLSMKDGSTARRFPSRCSLRAFGMSVSSTPP